MIRIPYGELEAGLARRLLALGFEAARADLCARLFAEATRDGVYSHGVNRFPRFLRQIEAGLVDIHATPVRIGGEGALERWDGRRGPGNLNARAAMQRAITLAREHGIGCVGLANTNHWMRGGTYGWQAAESGCIGICWTNTLPNLAPWGNSRAIVGNNPLVIAAPRPGGHIVVDMAMSQFSYGALEQYRKRGEPLPVDGGFDGEGRLTRDAAAIEASGRVLPIGYWKGSGLALALDVVAGLVSGGRFTHEITRDPERETALSQVFIAIEPGSGPAGARLADEVIRHLQAESASAGEAARYPGERVLAVRRENLEQGIPVEEAVWQEITGSTT